ncbi:methyltransferase [Candidatus Woesearchaeota archaeon]|nr:methyltransferase [Candidatus Woesearchaeota archaeon]
MNKKELEILLSKIASFDAPQSGLEQYATSSSIAADLVWNAFQNGHINEKVIADLGCGPGVLGIAALILGAKHVSFVDKDKKALAQVQKNISQMQGLLQRNFSCVFLLQDVQEFQTKVDVVLQNPPFGVQEVHADQAFLLTAMHAAPVIYSFHKFSTQDFVEKFVQAEGYHVVSFYRYEFPIKKQQHFHTQAVKYIDAACFLIEK